jgi:hypothetical protein
VLVVAAPIALAVIFYALFPAVVPALLKASWRSLMVVAVAAVVGGAQFSRLLEGFFYLLPASAQSVAGIYFSQLPCSIFGLMLFKFSAERLSVPESIARTCVLAIALLLFIPFPDGVKYALPLGLSTTYGISFLAICLLAHVLAQVTSHQHTDRMDRRGQLQRLLRALRRFELPLHPTGSALLTSQLCTVWWWLLQSPFLRLLI